MVEHALTWPLAMSSRRRECCRHRGRRFRRWTKRSTRSTAATAAASRGSRSQETLQAQVHPCTPVVASHFAVILRVRGTLGCNISGVQAHISAIILQVCDTYTLQVCDTYILQACDTLGCNISEVQNVEPCHRLHFISSCKRVPGSYRRSAE